MSFNNSGPLASPLSAGREKQLPPIPPSSEPLMAPKSLNRKNVKKLSFTPSSSKPQDADYSSEMSRFTALKTQQTKNKQRPAPLLHLAQDHETPSQPDIICSFKDLDLAAQVTRTERSLEEAAPSGVSQRKRRTVISSISPTKSTENSPSPRDHTQHVHGRNPHALSPMPSTPLAATSSAFNLRDDDLVHLKDLGSGNSGVVSKVLHIPSQKTMARKVVLVDSKSSVQTQIIRELRIMHECRSPYIIEFYGAFLRSNNSIVLCMEYLNCGSLDKIIKLCDHQQLPLLVLKKLSFSILSGLTYLYKTHKIIHRDIKPSNVLMSHKGDFKLCDFGVSRELTNSLAMADTFVGTSTYMSPERIQGHTYGVKSDIWSMGLMLFELASGGTVWSEDDDCDESQGFGQGSSARGSKIAGPEGILDLLQRIVNEKSPTLTNKTNKITNSAYDTHLCTFVDYCLIKNDKARKSPEELLQHKFLENVASGMYDKDMKAWAKKIRKQHKEKYEKE